MIAQLSVLEISVAVVTMLGMLLGGLVALWTAVKKAVKAPLLARMKVLSEDIDRALEQSKEHFEARAVLDKQVAVLETKIESLEKK